MAELKIQIDRDKEAHALPTTGAMGGVAPDGTSIAVHLFYEHVTLPDASFHEVDEESGLVNLKEGRQERDSSVTRRIHTSLIMSPQTAKRLGDWLLQKSQEAGEVSIKVKAIDKEEKEIL